MDKRKVRDLVLFLPGEESEDLDLLDAVPPEKTTVSGQLIEGDTLMRGVIDQCTITRSWFSDADLSSVEVNGTTLDRCVLRGCSLIGAHLTDVTLKNVIFENCRLDYATLANVRAAAPVAFLGCSLTETVFDRCKLTTAAFDACKLKAPTFSSCDMRGADFRDNDLSRVIGLTTSFHGCIITEQQVPGLMEAIARELELTIK